MKNRTNEIPRSGTHNGIKYNNKRTIVRVCRICDKYFIPNGRQQYCSSGCAAKAKRELMKKRNSITNPLRDKEQLRQKQAIRDAQTDYGEKKRTYRVAAIDISDPDNIDWDAQISEIKREKRYIGI